MEQFEKINWEMFQKLMMKLPHYATFFGLHDPYDMLLPDGSSKNIFEILGLIKEWLDELKSTVKYEALNDDRKIDWDVIEHAYELLRFSVYEHRTFETNPDAFEEIGVAFFVILTRNYAPIEKRVEAIISRMEKLPSFLEQFRTRFERSQPVKLWTEVAIESCQQIPALFQFIATATKGMISNNLHTKLIEAVQKLDQPINQHMEWLKSLLPKAKAECARAPCRARTLRILLAHAFNSNQ